MNTDYYDKLLSFLNYNVEKLNKDIILSKSKELGINFPDSLIRFYYYFGKCDEVLNGYYKFFKLEEIRVWNDGIIFGINDEKGTLGIQLKDLNKDKDPIVYYSYENDKNWYSELNYRGSEAFFFNISCVNILYHKPYIYKADICKTQYDKDSLINKYLSMFTDNEIVSKGYQRRGCLDNSGKVLASYWNLINVLFIASDRKEDLDEFANSTDINFKPFSFAPVKKPKKKKKLNKVDDTIMLDCYNKLIDFLPHNIEHIDESVTVARSKELGIKFPKQLIDFYRYFGNCDNILKSFYQIYKLDEVCVINNNLVFGTSDEGRTIFGISFENIEDDEPYIYEFLDKECTDIVDSFGISAFLSNTSCFQIMNTLDSMATVYISKKYFFSKILDKKNMYSFYDDKQLKNGYKMSACHSEDYSVIGCYIDDMLYVSANNDDILSEFEKKTKWNLDWL